MEGINSPKRLAICDDRIQDPWDRIIGIVNENKIPVKFIGVGEQIDDMEIFNSEEFVEAII